jgi:hypothetical protein
MNRLRIQLSGIRSVDPHLRRGRNTRFYWKLNDYAEWSSANLKDFYKLKKGMTCKFNLRKFTPV